MPVCDLCGTPIEYGDMYCSKCSPNGVTIFEGVTKEAHDKLKEQNALLQSEVERLREALVPAMEWVRQNGVDGNIGMLDAFAAAEIIRGLATELIGSAHNFQEIYNVQNRPPSAAE